MTHFYEVVKFVGDCRFATAFQIQRRFQKYFTSERTCRYQLESLVRLGHLETAPVRSTSPNFPFVFYATRRGAQAVRESLGGKATPDGFEGIKPHGLSRDFIQHELLVTEFDLAVWQTVQQFPGVECPFIERRYFQRQNQLHFRRAGEVRTVIPDSGFVLRFTSPPGIDGMLTEPSSLLHFTEVDNGTMPLSRILEKYRAYEQWAWSPEGREYLTSLYLRFGKVPASPTFRLLVIAHANAGGEAADIARLRHLLSQALPLPAAMRKRIWLTTAARLRTCQHDPMPLRACHWTRARDANPESFHRSRPKYSLIPMTYVPVSAASTL